MSPWFMLITWRIWPRSVNGAIMSLCRLLLIWPNLAKRERVKWVKVTHSLFLKHILNRVIQRFGLFSRHGQKVFVTQPNPFQPDTSVLPLLLPLLTMDIVILEMKSANKKEKDDGESNFWLYRK